jgi:hypothetical protein
MGCCSSQPEERRSEIYDRFDDVTKKIIDESGINNADLHELYDRWSNNFTFKRNGVMDYEEFTKALCIKHNVLVKRLFDKCVLDPDGEALTFAQFFCFLWTFLTIPETLGGSFLHLIYDSSCSGKMSLENMDVFVSDMITFLDPHLLTNKDEVTM